MGVESQLFTGENKRLRRCINDLVSILAMPAVWIGHEAEEIVRTLGETLLSVLDLDFIYAWLSSSRSFEQYEFVSLAEGVGSPLDRRSVADALRPWLQVELRKWPRELGSTIPGLGEYSIAPVRLGVSGEFGLIAAGSLRSDFPDRTELLVLNVAANQALIGLQEARLRKEQERLSKELDRRVAIRTTELATTNEELRNEIAKRTQAEQALRESEKDSRLIVDSIPGLIALLAGTGEVEVVNRQLLEYFGHTVEELRDWGSNGMIHPEDLPNVIKEFTESVSSGEPYKIVQRFRRSDGVYRWFENSGFPLRDAEGSVRRWCVLLTDIDERKRAEEAVQLSESNLKLIINTIPALAWSARPDGSADFFSQHYLDFVGLSSEQAADWGWVSAVHPDDLDGLVAAWERLLASATPGEAEARLRRSDGKYRWFLFRVNPLLSDSGDVIAWYGQNTDIEDRKRGEALLSESERQLKTIFDAAGVGISLVDLRVGEPIRNNRALQVMLGCTEQELSRFGTYDRLTHDANREMDAANFQELVRGERDTLRIEKHFLRDDGQSVWANAIFTLLRDDLGRPLYIIAIHEDITEQKHSLVKLQAYRDLLDLAQESAGAVAFDWYIQEDTNYWSSEQEALFGLAPGTFDGTYKTWKSMMYAQDWPGVVAAIQHARETGVVEAEYRVVWPDGSLHWLSTNGRMFFDEADKPLRMVGFTSDVSRRKMMEEKLKRSEAFLAEGQHLARMGNFTWKLDTGEIMWSEQLHRIFEFDPGSLITLELIATRVHPEDMPMLFDMVEKARAGVSDFEYEHRILLPDNSVKYLHMIAHRTQGGAGGPEYVGAVQDVTQRRLNEEDLSEARAELARVARVMSLGVLTAAIAHEVNQPLSGIITNANTCVRMLDADPPNLEGARETARRTIRDGNRASEVIARLRALFGRKESALEPVNLNEAAQEVIALSSSDLRRDNVTLETRFAPVLPVVTGDRVQLQQVILNILRNGSDAMKGIDGRPRRLLVTTAHDADQVIFSVKDSGVGIDPVVASKLFDAFYTSKPDGMGIGLSVSKSIIESHQGRIWAMQNDGPGATFSFSLSCLPSGFGRMTAKEDAYVMNGAGE